MFRINITHAIYGKTCKFNSMLLCMSFPQCCLKIALKYRHRVKQQGDICNIQFAATASSDIDAHLGADRHEKGKEYLESNVFFFY